MYKVESYTGVDVSRNDGRWLIQSYPDGLADALYTATYEAAENCKHHRIIEEATGRVIAVFGLSGKRLTFPIAIAIGAAAVAYDTEYRAWQAGFNECWIRHVERLLEHNPELRVVLER
jgi:hypothetical protein